MLKIGRNKSGLLDIDRAYSCMVIDIVFSLVGHLSIVKIRLLEKFIGGGDNIMQIDSYTLDFKTPGSVGWRGNIMDI